MAQWKLELIFISFEALLVCLTIGPSHILLYHAPSVCLLVLFWELEVQQLEGEDTVSQGRCHQLPQIWWRETTKIYSFSFGGRRSSSQCIRGAAFPQEALRGTSLPCSCPSLCCLPAFLGGPRAVDPSPQAVPPYVSPRVSSLLLRTQLLLDLGATLLLYNLILTNYVCKDPVSK